MFSYGIIKDLIEWNNTLEIDFWKALNQIVGNFLVCLFILVTGDFQPDQITKDNTIDIFR